MAASLIELIKVLRERTGAGMMDCKRALTAAQNDIEKAIVWLREQGIAKAQAKAARIALEGAAGVLIEKDKAVIAEINSETDFVARNARFHELVSSVLNSTLHDVPASIDVARAKTAALFSDATIALGEKLAFRRYAVWTKKDGQGFGGYIHMGGKIAVLLLLDKEDPELAKGLAMHIAANDPKYIRSVDISAEVKASELDIALKAAMSDEKLAQKPRELLMKIAERKAMSALAEITLADQVYLIDGKKKVGEILAAKGNKVIRFLRYAVGEGLTKDDAGSSEVLSFLS